MVFGDIALNYLVDEMGYNRCHGVFSPTHAPNGDIARVTDPPKCIDQRIAVWKATKKGERQFNGKIGCCIRDYFNEPLTAQNLMELQDQVESELRQVFPEFTVAVSRVRSDARNSVTIESKIGNFDITTPVSAGELEELHDSMSRMMKGLNIAMRDLKLGKYR